MPPELRIVPDPVLNKIAKPVTTFDKGLIDIVEDLKAGMIEYDGVGFAAPQMGLSIQAFVWDARIKGKNSRGYIFNPVIRTIGVKIQQSERCLSVPKQLRLVKRYQFVNLIGFDIHGRMVSYRANDFVARIFQHEYDHLQGKTIGDYDV